MSLKHLPTCLLSLSTTLLMVACAAADMEASSAPGGDQWFDAGNGNGGSTNPGADAGPNPEPPPAEEELDFDLRTPEAGGTFLYIPSAALDALVVVDASRMDVHLVDVGLVPTIVRALPNDEGAIVLNEGSSDVSIVRPNFDDIATRALDDVEPFLVETHDVLAGSNALVLSPDADFAFSFFDPSSVASDDESYGSLQDVAVLRLDAPEVFHLAVGFRPRDILFADNSLAFIVCDNGLSKVDLDTLDSDAFVPPIPTSDDPFRAPNDREILLTSDGAAAIVRDLGTLDLVHVDLETRTLNHLPLPDYASDLDLTADGKHVLVPMRARNELAIIDIPDAFLWAPPASGDHDTEDPENAENADLTNPFVTLVPTGAAFGSTLMTDDGRHALLYTTSPGVLAIGMLDLESKAVVIQPTSKEIEAVIASPDAKMAALLHRTRSGAGDLSDRPAYSLLDLASGYMKLVLTPNPLSTVTFTRDGAELFALIPDPTGIAHEAHRVSSRTFAVTAYSLPDRPVFVGAMPGVSKVAIALDNPTGWITFIDTETDELLQLNSFELNSFIE